MLTKPISKWKGRRAACLLGVATTLLSATALAAQSAPPAPPPALDAAQRLMQSGDFAGAAGALASIVESEPGNARAWRMLALASIRLARFEQAAAAYERALALEPEVAAARYNLGVAYARLGDRDRAFAALAAVKASRKVDMSQAALDEDLASLRDDPRFASILPAPADFADPFVEPVKILHEWQGESANDQFGWIARPVGDVDRDGAIDFVTSAPTWSSVAGKGDNAGRLYLYSTKSGRLLWTADGRPGDQLGTGLEGAGDTDGDGVADVVAGAPYADAVRIYSGRDGKLLQTIAGPAHSSFGWHVAGVGDVDGDGGSDLLVGAPGSAATAPPSPNGTPAAVPAGETGFAYLYSGRDGRQLFAWRGERDGDRFGSAVGGAVTSQKRLVVVGAPGAGPASTGRVYVYDALSAKPQFVIDSDATGNALGGMFVGVPGDVDGDAVPDVYASDWSNNAKGRSTGRIYVHSGRDGRRLFELTGETAGEGFGTSHSRAGDVDGDGHADLIVGAWQHAGAAVSGGRAQLYSGKDGSLLRSYTCRTVGDTFGFDAVTLGDVDGDSNDDFLITSGWSAVRGFHSGRVFLLSSGIAKRPRPGESRPAG